MAARLSEDQQAIREAARDYLRDHADLDRLRRHIDAGGRADEALWRGFAQELGFAGLGIAETYGGAGLGPVEQALVLEELGRTLAPIPFFESAVLAAGLIDAAASEARKAALLPGIAAGATIATLAAREVSGDPLPAAIGPVLTGDRLTGAAHYVPFGDAADLLIVAARDGEGVTLLTLPADTNGITVEPLTSLDLTRPLARIGFDLELPADAFLGARGGAAAALESALARAGGLLAAEQLGVAARSLEETVAYAKERVQFGRVIGSFQAVKHRLADMKLAVDEARAAVGWAAAAIADGEDVALACAGARVRCTEAALACTADAIQLHGGIGFTWEHHAHLFFKRARAAATLLDPPAVHRERIARALLDNPASEPPA